MTEDFKILFYRGFAKDLPEALNPAEIAVALDIAMPIIGSDPQFGNPIYNRSVFPYQNIEILTEKSQDTYSRLHSARMRDSDNHDYYAARLEPDTLAWTNVIAQTGETLLVFALPISGSLTSYIDYAACLNSTGEPVQSGRLTVSMRAIDTTVSVSDDSIRARDLTLIGPDTMSANDSFYRMSLRFVIDPQDPTRAIMQYRNYTFSPIAMSFKTSTPSEVLSSNNNFGQQSSLIVFLSNNTIGYTTAFGAISSQISPLGLGKGAYNSNGPISATIHPIARLHSSFGPNGPIASSIVITASAHGSL